MARRAGQVAPPAGDLPCEPAEVSAQRIAYLSCETFVNEFISAFSATNCPPSARVIASSSSCSLTTSSSSRAPSAARRNSSTRSTISITRETDRGLERSAATGDQRAAGALDVAVQERPRRAHRPASYEMRVAILNRKAELREVRVPRKSLTTSRRSSRQTSASWTARSPRWSLRLAAETAHHARPGAGRVAGAGETWPGGHGRDILRVVTTRYNVRVSDLQSRKRTRSIVLPRQICMYLARALTTLSLEEIGGFFGGRDHSTVMHAEARITSSLEQDVALAHTIEALKHDLRAPVSGRRSGTGAVADS